MTWLTLFTCIVQWMCAGPPIHHYDLYRLTASTDMNRLDLAQSFNEAVSLLEWADRLQAASLPDSRLDVRIDILDEVGMQGV